MSSGYSGQWLQWAVGSGYSGQLGTVLQVLQLGARISNQYAQLNFSCSTLQQQGEKRGRRGVGERRDCNCTVGQPNCPMPAASYVFGQISQLPGPLHCHATLLPSLPLPCLRVEAIEASARQAATSEDAASRRVVESLESRLM